MRQMFDGTTLRHSVSRAVIGAGAVIILMAPAARAQGENPFTVRVLAGASQPGGDLKSTYSSGGLVGAQGTWRFNDWFGVAVTSTWANVPTTRASDHVADYGTAWSFDGGVELRHPKIGRTVGSSWQLDPFVGGGYGTRTYMLPRTNEADATEWAGYGAVGADLDHKGGGLGVRIEGRDYTGSYTDPQRILPKTNFSEMKVFLGITYR